MRGYAVYAAFLLQEFVLVSVTGATIGKQLCGIRVVRAADGGRSPWPWVLARTVLLGLLVPAVIWDRDGRGLHDRAAGALTRARRPARRRLPPVPSALPHELRRAHARQPAPPAPDPDAATRRRKKRRRR